MQNKFQTLGPWMEEIVSSIKKEIKTDFLESNPVLRRAYFGNLPQNRINVVDISAAFTKEIEKGNEGIADFVIDRWVVKHGNIYQHFAERLYSVNPNFDQIKELTPEQSEQVLAGAKESFGARDTYIFSVFNGVVFPSFIFTRLLQEAQEESERMKTGLKS